MDAIENDTRRSAVILAQYEWADKPWHSQLLNGLS